MGGGGGWGDPSSFFYRMVLSILCALSTRDAFVQRV